MGREDVVEDRRFGDSQVHTKFGPSLSSLSPLSRVEAVGRSHACPVIKKVIAEFGLDWTFKRYTECNWVNEKEIWQAALRNNLELYDQLTSPTERVIGEIPDTELDRSNLPESFDSEISPLSHPVGYGFPRATLVFAKGDREKVIMSRLILDRCSRNARDPIGYMLMAVEEYAANGADVEKMLKHIMAKNILIEQGCRSIFKTIALRMEEEAPELARVYKLMIEREKVNPDREIIIPQDLE